MNPISNSQIAQATHQEYEAQYGSYYNGDVPHQEIDGPVMRQRLVLAFGGLSILLGAILITLF